MDATKALIGLCPALLLAAGCVGARSRPVVSPLQETAAGVVLQDPSSPEKWVEYGVTCIFSTNYPGAIEAFRMALEIDREYLPAYEHLALALSAIREYKAAAQVCREGLKVDPESAPLWLRYILPRSLTRHRRPVRSESAPLWLRYGYCLNDMDDLDSALAAFSKVLSLPCEDSHRASALFGRATVYTKQGMTEEAVIAFREAIQLCPPEIVETLSGQQTAPR